MRKLILTAFGFLLGMHSFAYAQVGMGVVPEYMAQTIENLRDSTPIYSCSATPPEGMTLAQHTAACWANVIQQCDTSPNSCEIDINTNGTPVFWVIGPPRIESIYVRKGKTVVKDGKYFVQYACIIHFKNLRGHALKTCDTFPSANAVWEMVRQFEERGANILSCPQEDFCQIAGKISPLTPMSIRIYMARKRRETPGTTFQVIRNQLGQPRLVIIQEPE